MTKDRFKKLVNQAICEMPERIKARLDNVSVVVEDKPSKAQLQKAGIGRGILFGLYQGIPQSERWRGYSGALPDKITLFKDSFEKVARTEKQLKTRVKKTLWHEFAHHFGYDERGVRELQDNLK